MPDILLWNSMATRRRSSSDLFQENGLHILRSHLKNKGFEAEIVDWATPDGYRALSPPKLVRWNRNLLEKLFSAPRPFWPIPFFRLTGSLLSRIQKKRMERRLKDLAGRIAQEKIPVLGIKVWYGEAFRWSEYLCRTVKRRCPETVVIAGGYHVSLYQEDLLKNSSFDLAVEGPGETALAAICESGKLGESRSELLDWIRSNSSQLPGLLLPTSGGMISIPHQTDPMSVSEEQALPEYPRNSGKIGIHVLKDSLGCPWGQCYFCVHNQFSPAYRCREISDIILEIKAMRRQGIGLFRFAGSETPPLFGKRIAEAILDENLQIRYTIGCRGIPQNGEMTQKELIDCFAIMIRSGLRGVFIGGETGEDTINRKIMNKGLTAGDLLYTVKALREAEKKTGKPLSISLAFIYPTPLTEGITDEDVRTANLDLIAKAAPDAVMITPPGPFRGSTWFAEQERFGFRLGDSFIRKMMSYEYVLTKPLSLWPDLNIELQGRDFKSVMKISQDFRMTVEKDLDIPTDLSDEHFLMIQAIRQFHKQGIKDFKRQSLLAILSTDYSYLDEIGRRISERSRLLTERT